MTSPHQRASRRAEGQAGSRALRDPELSFLLAALDLRAPLRELAGEPLDWRQLLSIAAHARMLPLLAQRVLTGPDACSDPDARRQLTERLQEMTVHTTRLLAELARASTVLERAGVAHVALKGAVLMARHYPHAAMRHAVDLDLLLDPARFERGLEALRAAGYVEAPYTRRLGFDGRSSARALDAPHLHACTPLQAPSGIVLDLHRRVPTAGYEAQGGFPGWLARAERHELHGVHVQLSSRDDLALHLCEHFALQDAAEPSEAPRLLCDLRVLYPGAPPWAELAAGATRRTRFALELARRLYVAAFERPVAHDAATRALQRIAAGDPPLGVQLAACSRLLRYAARLRHDLAARPGFALRKLVPARSYLAERYGIDRGSPRLYARYVTRLFGLTRGAAWPPP